MSATAQFDLVLPNLEATQALAARLADVARPGLTLLLDGPVGAGKSTLAREILRNLMAREGRVEDIPSPTFTLVQTYELSGFEAWHSDLYRLSSVDELIELGLETAFETAFCLVEWSGRLGTLRPLCAIEIALTPDKTDPDKRYCVLSGPDDVLNQLMAAS